MFGFRHERFVPATAKEQLALGVWLFKLIEYTRKQSRESTEKVQTGRMKLPADLSREQVILESAEDINGFRKIGEAITGVLEHIPRKLFVCQYENGTEWHYLQTFPGHSSPNN